ELPQFFNVLKGDMSIVGPRPHAVSAKAGGLLYQEAVQQYAARHRVKPGITGWAQINGWRGETETVEQIRRRVHHDIAYIENWSLWLDLKIILLTAFVGFTGKNAF
ncbi:MAG TPA: sugar transferase, partial [Alphaproteobacteria bacterium]|nr:sugar transferase [Alphaproteobacteria bacterium]